MGKFPSHVFISFSARDQENARSLTEHLRQRGVPVWIAPEALIPGTPNWDAAIREALGRSFAVVLLASEDSAQSPYVFGEIEVAKAADCRIFSVWVRGSEWARCVPIGLVSSQYIDLRHDERGPALESLCQTLQGVMREVMPRRCLESYGVRHSDRGIEITLPKIPHGYGMIDLDSEARWQPGAEEGRAVFLRTADYRCLNAVLDDLYLGCLQERYRPNTYGTDWILKEKPFWSSCEVLLVPWAWLTNPHMDRHSLSEWLLDTPAAALLPRQGAIWEIRPPGKVRPVGLALKDEQLLKAMQGNPKALSALMPEVLRECQASEVTEQEYAHRVVIEVHRFGPHHVEPRGQTATVLAQTAAPVPPRLLEYWLDGSF
jgi:hypothetical protein